MTFTNTNRLFFLLIICNLFFSCTQIDVFEKNTNITKNEWKSTNEIKGNFNIKDSATSYITYIVLRHTDAYKYTNIWLNVGIQAPNDTMQYQKVNLQLGFDAGGWMGSGMDDIWEIRQPIFYHFKKTGVYSYSITQAMRDDPLASIMSIGFRVQKNK